MCHPPQQNGLQGGVVSIGLCVSAPPQEAEGEEVPAWLRTAQVPPHLEESGDEAATHTLTHTW